MTNTTSHLNSSAACFRRALVAAHVTMRATTMILFVALVALAFPQGTHAGCLTDQAVEGFFEGLVRLVDAIPVGRDFVSRGSRSLSVASALEVTRSRRARRRRVRARQRERSRRRRALAMTRDVARAFRDTFFQPRAQPRVPLGTEPSVGRDENLPPGPPPSLLRSRHMAFPDDPSAASLFLSSPSLRRLESPPAGSPSRTAAA